jgi:hypothetical protein
MKFELVKAEFTVILQWEVQIMLYSQFCSYSVILVLKFSGNRSYSSNDFMSFVYSIFSGDFALEALKQIEL